MDECSTGIEAGGGWGVLCGRRIGGRKQLVLAAHVQLLQARESELSSATTLLAPHLSPWYLGEN